MTHTSPYLASIERAVSRERLKRYFVAAPNDLGLALYLYEQNVALSEMTFGILHGLEVAVRNSMHDEPSMQFKTPRWFDVAPLSSYSQDKVSAAIRDAGGVHASPGKIVAELMLGFWTDLAAQRYHWTLWQPCLSKAFPNVKLARPLIHRRLEEIRWLRNRIAHHEPILTSKHALYVGHGRYLSLTHVIECGEWISPSLGRWLMANFRFAEANAIVNAIASSGWVLP